MLLEASLAALIHIVRVLGVTCSGQRRGQSSLKHCKWHHTRGREAEYVTMGYIETLTEVVDPLLLAAGQSRGQVHIVRVSWVTSFRQSRGQAHRNRVNSITSRCYEAQYITMGYVETPTGVVEPLQLAAEQTRGHVDIVGVTNFRQSRGQAHRNSVNSITSRCYKAEQSRWATLKHLRGCGTTSADILGNQVSGFHSLLCPWTWTRGYMLGFPDDGPSVSSILITHQSIPRVIFVPLRCPTVLS